MNSFLGWIGGKKALRKEIYSEGIRKIYCWAGHLVNKKQRLHIGNRWDKKLFTANVFGNQHQKPLIKVNASV